MTAGGSRCLRLPPGRSLRASRPESTAWCGLMQKIAPQKRAADTLAPMAAHLIGPIRGRPRRGFRGRQWNIGVGQRGTLMRHFLLSRPITALSFGMAFAAAAALLIAASRRAQRRPARLISARRTAIAIAPITVTAERHLASTAGTEVQTSGVVHRRLPPMRAGMKGSRGA